MRECWKRSQGKAREAPATERAVEQIGSAYSHRASAPLYYVLHRRGGALLRVLPARNGAGGLHHTGLDAAYGQGNVSATGGSWRSTGERSGAWGMARRNLR